MTVTVCPMLSCETSVHLWVLQSPFIDSAMFHFLLLSIPVKKFLPACGFSIGFERIILLLLESGFQVPGQSQKAAYLIEKNYPEDKLVEVIALAQEQRKEGKQVLVTTMNKNRKFQKEKLTAEGGIHSPKAAG